MLGDGRWGGMSNEAPGVTAFHLAPMGVLADLHDLPPVLVPAITLGMVP